LFDICIHVAEVNGLFGV